MRVYLADLGHNILTYSSDTYPLGAANIAQYVHKYLDSAKPVEVRLFRDPQELKVALDDALPDVLGLSNYTWNEELAYHFAKYAKAKDEDVFTVMGGPNWPLFESVQEQFLRDKPMVDAYVDGPTYEGERAFLNLVQRHLTTKRDIRQTLAEGIPGNTFLLPDGTFSKGTPIDRINDLDEIPSPYLAGMMDPYFKTGFLPLLQISRGCPFTCAFCNSGVRGNSKVYAHSFENVKADLLYIAERIKPEVSLSFADDNFGMYERDVEIADYIGWLQDTYKWPMYIRTTTGKNKGERIIKVMRKIKGALPMTAAVQSMNPVVLKNIKRSNIKLETYAQLQDELKSQGMQSYGELILCLPGETPESFLDAIKKFLDTGASRISAHQLMLLHGAELSNPDSRERFQLKTKWRVVARNLGNYTGEPIVEVEEMVVSTPTISFQQYLDLRVFHLLLTTFFYEGNFEEAFEFAKAHGIHPFNLHLRLQERLDKAPAELKKVIDDFLTESQEELFDSREEVIAWSKEHYDELIDGTLGGNLLSKYSMLGRFYATHPALDFLQQTITELLDEAETSYDAGQLAAVMDYLRKTLLHVPFAESIAATVQWQAEYDVEAWAAEHYEKPLADYRLDAPKVFAGEVTEDKKRMIETKVETFGEGPHGLGKFTRTMFARDLRRSFQRDD